MAMGYGFVFFLSHGSTVLQGLGYDGEKDVCVFSHSLLRIRMRALYSSMYMYVPHPPSTVSLKTPKHFSPTPPHSASHLDSRV